MRFFMLLLLPLSFATMSFAAPEDHLSSVEVYKTKKRKPQVSDFCQRHPIECERTGSSSLLLTPELLKKIQKVNRDVNHEIQFVLDPDQYQEEEFWNLPSSGMGDCEDNALEKRSRLAKLGIPRGAMSMATAFHKKMLYAHGLLLIETDRGTFVLDQDQPEVLLWHETAYGFESREKIDGTWEYFVQDWLD